MCEIHDVLGSFNLGTKAALEIADVANLDIGAAVWFMAWDQ
jgi:hypothetical protein